MSIRNLLKYVTFIFVPLVNPDGANLVINGGKFISKEKTLNFVSQAIMKMIVF